MRLLNIDRSSDDTFYRYKMEPVAVKIEGRGNGIKTVLINIEEIARSLRREPKHLTKYLSYEMGTLSSIDEDNSKYIINGAHEKERVQEYLYNFIDELVLCKECRNPETDLFCVPGKKTVHQKCKACGEEAAVKSSNKIMKILLKDLEDVDVGKDSEEFEDFQEEDYVFGK